MIADLEARISNVLVHKNKTVAIPSISINSDDDKAGKFAEWYSHTLNYFEEELLQYGNSAASGSAFVTFNSIIRGVHSTSLHDGTNPATSNVNTLADMEMTPVYSDYLMKIDSDMYDLFREFILASINDAGLVTVIRDHNPSPTSLKCQSLILIVRNHYVVSSSAMPLTATMIPFRLDNGQGQSSFAYITASTLSIISAVLTILALAVLGFATGVLYVALVYYANSWLAMAVPFEGEMAHLITMSIFLVSQFLPMLVAVLLGIIYGPFEIVYKCSMSYISPILFVPLGIAMDLLLLMVMLHFRMIADIYLASMKR